MRNRAHASQTGTAHDRHARPRPRRPPPVDSRWPPAGEASHADEQAGQPTDDQGDARGSTGSSTGVEEVAERAAGEEHAAGQEVEAVDGMNDADISRSGQFRTRPRAMATAPVTTIQTPSGRVRARLRDREEVVEPGFGRDGAASAGVRRARGRPAPNAQERVELEERVAVADRADADVERRPPRARAARRWPGRAARRPPPEDEQDEGPGEHRRLAHLEAPSPRKNPAASTSSQPPGRGSPVPRHQGGEGTAKIERHRHDVGVAAGEVVEDDELVKSTTTATSPATGPHQRRPIR